MELNCPFCGSAPMIFEAEDEYACGNEACFMYSCCATKDEWNRRAENDREAVLTHTLELRVQELDATADILEQTRRENADLLAALKMMLDALTYGGEDANDYMDAAEQQARAAIARHEHE